MSFKHTENLMLSKRYESTEVDRRTEAMGDFTWN